MKRDSMTLGVNAHLKYTEYLLCVFDRGNENLTLKDIRKQFEKEFSVGKESPSLSLLNNYFGIYRLVPLMFIKETYKDKKEPLKGDIKK